MDRHFLRLQHGVFQQNRRKPDLRCECDNLPKVGESGHSKFTTNFIGCLLGSAPDLRVLGFVTLTTCFVADTILSLTKCNRYDSLFEFRIGTKSTWFWMMNVRSFFLGCVVFLLGATGTLAQSDMEGSSDHPEFARLSDAIITAYYFAEASGAEYATGAGNEVTAHYVSGDVTRLLYVLPAGQAADDVFLTYLEAFESFGESTFEAYYGCNAGSCPRDMSGGFQWPLKSERSPAAAIFPDEPIVPLPDFILRYPQWHADVGYLAGKVANETGSYVAAVYIAESKRTIGVFTEGQTFVDLLIIENTDH
ncbi:MAG: hypothetical protein ABJG96_13425 [Paracoccaceae bacterium]